MKTELKIGDRIKIYGFDSERAEKVLTRVVSAIGEEDGIILTDGGEYVHPKQCRRLKPRQTPRTIWVEFGAETREPRAVADTHEELEVSWERERKHRGLRYVREYSEKREKK